MLGGGITNHNVKLCFDDGETYVLRVAGERTDLLGIDRAVEHEASIEAAAVGVGPEVVAFVEPEGWLVTRFIEAGSCRPGRFASGCLRRVAVAHSLSRDAGPPIAGRFDSFRVVEAYRETAEATARAFPRASSGRTSSRGGSSVPAAQCPSGPATTTC